MGLQGGEELSQTLNSSKEISKVFQPKRVNLSFLLAFLMLIVRLTEQNYTKQYKMKRFQTKMNYNFYKDYTPEFIIKILKVEIINGDQEWSCLRIAPLNFILYIYLDAFFSCFTLQFDSILKIRTYADDLVIIVDPHILGSFIQMFDDHSQIWNLKLNKQKSGIFFTNRQQKRLRELQGIPILKQYSYLGILNVQGNLKSQTENLDFYKQIKMVVLQNEHKKTNNILENLYKSTYQLFITSYGYIFLVQIQNV